MKELLDHRAKAKAKKPKFERQEAHKIKRLSKVWRRPKGRDSKLRLQFRDKGKIVKTGYGSPVAVKGLLRDGMEGIVVANVSDVQAINSKTQVGIIQSTVGGRGRAQIIEAAVKAGIKLTNGDEKTLVAIKKDLEDRKKARSVKKKAPVVEEKPAAKKETSKDTKDEKKSEPSVDKKKEDTLKAEKEMIKKGAQ